MSYNKLLKMVNLHRSWVVKTVGFSILRVDWAFLWQKQVQDERTPIAGTFEQPLRGCVRSGIKNEFNMILGFLLLTCT
jgi:hypothetical protein